MIRNGEQIREWISNRRIRSKRTTSGLIDDADAFVTGRVLNSTDEFSSTTKSPMDIVREKIGPGLDRGFGKFPVEEEADSGSEATVRQWDGGGDFYANTSAGKNVTVSLFLLPL